MAKHFDFVSLIKKRKNICFHNATEITGKFLPISLCLHAYGLCILYKFDRNLQNDKFNLFVTFIK